MATATDNPIDYAAKPSDVIKEIMIMNTADEYALDARDPGTRQEIIDGINYGRYGGPIPMIRAIMRYLDNRHAEGKI